MSNEYTQQAKTFCEKYGVKIKIIESPIQTPPAWCKEGENHGIKYDITISRANRKDFSFPFWDSIDHKEKLQAIKNLSNGTMQEKKQAYYRLGLKIPNNLYHGFSQLKKEKAENLRIENRPDEYSILACLEKYDPETFEDFCMSFDYDTDSIKARETFEAVDKE